MAPRGNDLNLGRIAGTGNSLVFPKSSRDKHLFVCGGTGTGKSKFLEHLVRQDIGEWFKTRSGMLLLDPHGSLYDSVITWLAGTGVTRIPIIPIDLRQDDWIVSYNALRKREVANPSVVVGNFVQAIAMVWGQSGTDRTPRFERWVTSILTTLYEKGLTLLEAEYLMDHLDREARRVLSHGIEDKASVRDWTLANELKPREFEAELGSTANRLQRFLRNPHMRTMFGQPGVSLDLRKALDEGHIILVSLATAGARVSGEDADLFARLLLSDLWTAALERGKKPDLKPFRVYADEFQRFVTPTIAQNLDEARGFGIQMTVANQFPHQLLDQGNEGKRLYHSILENASSKVVFRLTSEENLRPLAEWLFRGVFNPDEVKHKIEATRVMGYREEERASRTTGTTRTASVTKGQTESFMTITGETESKGASHSRSVREDEYGNPINLERGITTGDVESGGRSSARSEGHQESVSTSESLGETDMETVSSILVPILGTEISSVQFRSLEEQLHRAMAALFDQEERESSVRLVGMKAPVSIQTPTVSSTRLRPERIKAYVAKLLQKWPFALPFEQAAKELAAREKEFEAKLREPQTREEPTTSRRRISPA